MITDLAGCSIGTTIVIVEPARLTATASATPSNCANDGSATVRPIGGTRPYTYNWIPSAGSDSTLQNVSAGFYIVTITDANLCSVTAAASVNSLVTITPESTLKPVTCHDGSDGSILMATSGENPPFNYTWSYGGSVSNPLIGLPSGRFNVTITDANGCQAIRAYEIQQPEAMAVTPLVTSPLCDGLCNGIIATTMTGGNGGYVYTWSRNNEHAAFINGVCAGNYTVSVTDIKGCTYVSPAIAVTAPDVMVVDTIVVTQPTCYGSRNAVLAPHALGGTPSYLFDWGNIGFGIVSSLSVGTYEVTATDSKGCSATRSVSVSEPPPVVGAVTRTNLQCAANESGTIRVDTAYGGNGSPFTFSLNNAAQQQTPLFVGLNAGTYNVHIYDVAGCEVVLPTFISQPAPLSIDAGGPFQITLGDSVRLAPQLTGFFNPNYIYTWTPSASLSCANCAITWAHPLQTTTYTFMVRDTAAGCTATDRVLVDVITPENVFIPNLFTPNADGINDVFTVFGGISIQKVQTLRVFSRWGTLVHEANNFAPGDLNSGWDGMLNGRKMNPGTFVYYVVVEFIDGKTAVFQGDIVLVR